MDPTTRFAALVGSRDASLGECAFAIAAHDHELDLDAALARLDELAAGVEVASSAGLCRHLFVEEAFGGNRGDYYDPRNSFLDCVLERRLGIPLTLSILAIEVGRRCGVALVGIGMPGHFLVRDAIDPNAFFDPFGAGVELDRAGCEARLRQVAGAEAHLGPGDLEPATTLEIVTRMLANLQRIYMETSDRSRLAWVLRLRSLMPGADLALRRQLAGVLAGAGRFWEAAAELDTLAALEPEQAATHRQAADRLRARLN